MRTSQSAEKCGEVGLLCGGEPHVEAGIVELDHVRQRRGTSIVEVRPAPREPPEDRTFEGRHVRPLAGDQCHARIGRLRTEWLPTFGAS